MTDIIGMDELVAKQSAVNAAGKSRAASVPGVEFRPTRPVPHDHGVVTEIARASWNIIKAPITQVHQTTTLPGRVRAWSIHQKGTDRLFVVSGLIKFAVFDGRQDSKTFGSVTEMIVSEKNPGLLIIEPCLYHGWKNIGAGEAVVINMPNEMYDYEAPDAFTLPWESETAQRIIPYQW
jgi:dTDP-4-dehydrorhamnose 3,5-epimerase